MKQTSQQTRTLLQTLLDGVEQVGNKVPHPAVIFLVLMGVVVLLSQAFSVLGTSVSYQRINPQTHDLEDVTATVKSLLSADGIRFLFTSAVRNFLNFGPVGVILVAIVGVGLAEQAGLAGFNMTPSIERSADVTIGVSTSVPMGVGCIDDPADLDAAKLRDAAAAYARAVGKHFHFITVLGDVASVPPEGAISFGTRLLVDLALHVTPPAS
jgi:p-aminobenzoyl-glutamate transporter AbgT